MRKLKLVQVSPSGTVDIETEFTIDEQAKLKLFVFKSDDIDSASLEKIRDALRGRLSPDVRAIVVAVGAQDSVELYEVE